MVRLKRRLDELVADAGECHLRGGAVHDWVAGPWPNWAARFAWLALTVAEGAAGAARQGDYRRARKLAELNAVYLPEWAADALDSEVSLEGCAAWAAFRAACELAERIDCFLAAVGRGPQGAGLAADCREC